MLQFAQANSQRNTSDRLRENEMMGRDKGIEWMAPKGGNKLNQGMGWRMGKGGGEAKKKQKKDENRLLSSATIEPALE